MVSVPCYYDSMHFMQLLDACTRANAIMCHFANCVIVSGPTGAGGTTDARTQDLAVEKGTIHTKRHSGEDHIKNGYVNILYNQ